MIKAGQTAVITAGGNGIGREVAASLMERGLNVVIADIDEAAASRAAAQLSGRGRCLGVRCDVRDEAALHKVREVAEREFGTTDLLINHAGGALHGPLEQIGVADWEWLLDLNILGMVRALRVFLPSMIAANSGHLVFTTSSLALISGHPFAGSSVPYITSKGAVISLAQSVHEYVSPLGIGVTLFAPEYTETNFPNQARRVGGGPPRGGSAIPYPPQTPQQAAKVLISALDTGDFLASATPGCGELLAAQAQAGLDPSALRSAYQSFSAKYASIAD